MKKLLVVCICLFLCVEIGFAQVKKIKAPSLPIENFSHITRSSWQGYAEKSAELWKVIYHNKQNIIQEEILFSDNTFLTKHGEYKRYKNGKVYFQGKYENNEKQGLWHYFDDHDRLVEEISYKNNIYHGTRTTFWPDGSQKRMENYVDGRLNGLSLLYHANGKIASKEVYLKDSLQLGATYLDHNDQAVDKSKIITPLKYEGGEAMFYKDIIKGLFDIIPIIDNGDKLDYTTHVRYRISKVGELEEVEFLDEKNKKIQRVILNSFKSLKKMTPAYELGGPVPYTRLIPLRAFKP